MDTLIKVLILVQPKPYNNAKSVSYFFKFANFLYDVYVDT